MSKTLRPPKVLEKLLWTILPIYLDETALGDFEEEYSTISQKSGLAIAMLWYCKQIVKSIPPFLINSLLWWGIMLKNYMIIALRDLKKNKIYSFINIFGLAIGIACCIVIVLFVQDELSYDRYHENADQIYRITSKRQLPGRELHTTLTRANFGPNIKNEFPEVIDFVRLMIHRWFVIEHDGKRFTTDPCYADPSILEMFTYPLAKGDKKTALKEPNSVIISEDLAQKIFGSDDPLGEIIIVYDLQNKFDLKVTGVLKNIPFNSHFRFDFLAPFEHLRSRTPDKDISRTSCMTYILLEKNANPETLKEKMPSFVEKHYSQKYASQMTHHLQPLTSIHLNSHLSLELGKNSNISYSFTLSLVAFIILLIACINYMNLTTARSSRRSREVGIRKVIGAGRLQLFRQFLGESIILTFFALIIGIILAYFLLPFFNANMGKHLTINFEKNLFLYSALLLLALITGFLSNCYPAIFLSSYQPVEVLKGDIKKGTRFGIHLRKGLVIFQFAVSLIFIIGTIIIFQQLNFVKNKDLGFEKSNIIEIPIFKDKSLAKRSELLKNELSQHPNITEVIVTEGAPGMYNGWPVQCIPEGFSEDKPAQLNLFIVGEDFFRFFGMDIIRGRDFSSEITSDARTTAILNETAVEYLGWKSPLGKLVRSDRFPIEAQDKGLAVKIIGIVRDFHNGPLHQEIKPSIYLYDPTRYSSVFIKMKPDNIQETIAFLEEKWRSLPTHLLFFYYFIEDSLENSPYVGDKKVRNVFTFSSALAIIIACLGIFGLISYTADRRKKEIGIRKVLGASISRIVLLLSKDLTLLVLIANVIAWPLGYYVVNRWLQNFAYRINISFGIFIFGAIIVLMITLITISFQSLKSATSNPVDVIRYE